VGSDRLTASEAGACARAIGVGWPIDTLGLLAWLWCRQADPGFWVCRPDLGLGPATVLLAGPGWQASASAAA